MSSVLYLVWAKTDFTGTCCSKSPVHRLSWKFGGRAPPQLQRVLALSPPRVGRFPCAQLRTTRDAAPSPARRARSMHAAVAVEVFHLPPSAPCGEPDEGALRPTPLPADSCRTAGIEEMGLHRIRQSVVAYNKRPSRRNSGLLDYDRQPKGTNVSPERRGRQGIKLTTGSEACGREASRRAGKARPVPLTRLPLITRLLMLLGSRHTTRPAHAEVCGHHTTVSPLLFIAYPQTRVPAPSVPGPYAGAASAGPNPFLIALNPLRSYPPFPKSTDPYSISRSQI